MSFVQFYGGIQSATYARVVRIEPKAMTISYSVPGGGEEQHELVIPFSETLVDMKQARKVMFEMTRDAAVGLGLPNPEAELRVEMVKNFGIVGVGAAQRSAVCCQCTGRRHSRLVARCISNNRPQECVCGASTGHTATIACTLACTVR